MGASSAAGTTRVFSSVARFESFALHDPPKALPLISKTIVTKFLKDFLYVAEVPQ